MSDKRPVKENNLTITHPELATQWHPTLNGDLTPEMVSKGTVRKVWWLYPYDVPMDYPVEHLRGKHFDFEWESSPNCRTNNDSGCPYLSNPPKAVWKGFNDLETVNPELAAQWDYKANKGLKDKNGNDISTPDKVTAKSGWVVNWTLPYDVPIDYHIKHLRGKHFDFKWKSEIKNRNSGKECPYLSKPAQAVWPGFNDLETTNPELAKEWHPINNMGLIDKNGRDISTPDKVSGTSAQKVWWLLPYDVPMDYPIKHLRGNHYDFEWEANIGNRAGLDAGCPYLVGKAVWKGFNDLATTHPEIAKQWHPTKNIGLKNKYGQDISSPDKITAGSSKKVWWYLPYDDQKTGEHYEFEWKASVEDRVLWMGCPFLLSSKGEEAVKKILTDKKILFETEYKFKDRLGPSQSQPLRDDFAIFDNNGEVVATIEFHGEQHYKPVDFAGKGKEWAEEHLRKTKERDNMKSKYLKDHGIKQLIISYKDFDNAPQIVGDFIKELSKTHDLSQPSKEIKAKINNNQKDIQTWQPPVQSSLSSKEVKAFIKNTLNGDKKQKSTKENKKIIKEKRKSLDINL